MTCDSIPQRRNLSIHLANTPQTPPRSSVLATPLAPPTCPICCCAYTCGIRKPKLLPGCGHTFCAPCLETMGVGAVCCPLCRCLSDVGDCRLLKDDEQTVNRVRQLQVKERLYPTLSPLKPPPTSAFTSNAVLPQTPVKTRAVVGDIPTSALKPPSCNLMFSQTQQCPLSQNPVAKTRRHKRLATSPPSRLDQPLYAPTTTLPAPICQHSAPTAPTPPVPTSPTSACDRCGYNGQHSPVKCASSRQGYTPPPTPPDTPPTRDTPLYDPRAPPLSDAYFTAPDEFYTTCTSQGDDDVTSSNESLDDDCMTHPCSDHSRVVRRTNSLPSNKRRSTSSKYHPSRTRNLSAPISHIAKLGKQLRRRSDGESIPSNPNSGELCAMKLIQTFGEFSLSPNTPGCFRKPNKIAVSRYNGHIAVVDSVYATVQIFNRGATKSLNMIDLVGITSCCFVSSDTIVCGNHLGLNVYTYTSSPVHEKRQLALSNVLSLSPYHGDNHDGAFIAVQSKVLTVFSGSKLKTLFQLHRRVYPQRVFRKQISFRSLIDCCSTRRGDLIALDSSSCKLYLMDRHGRVIVSIDSRKELCGRFKQPISVTADHFNDIYVSDKDRILKFSAEGLFSRAMLRVTGHLLPMSITSCLTNEKDHSHSESHLLVSMFGIQKSQAVIRVYSI